MLQLARLSIISLMLMALLVGSRRPAFSAEQQSPSAASAISVSQSHIDRAVASLDSLANNLLRKTGVPGMAIAVVRGEKIIYARGFGVRKVGTTLKVDADTVFLLASVSKSLASTVVSGAVGHGRVKWSDPVVKYLPGFTLSDSYVGSHVTIADMFAHRSGLPDHAGDLLEDLAYGRSEIIHRLALEPLEPFRITYNYTNFGLTAGAQAVADAEGLTWEDLAQRELYGPLAMSSTSSRWSDYNRSADKADIHIKLRGVWKVSARQPDAESPAGGASSSVHDLAKWMMLELAGGTYSGKQVIDKKALQQTQQPLMLTAPAIPPSRASFYGLGMGIGYDEAGRLHLSHSGAFSMGTATAFDLLPSEHLGIVILTNGMPMGVPETLGKEFYDIVEFGSVKRDWFAAYSGIFARMMTDRGELAGKQPPAHSTPALPASSYVGKYENAYYGPALVEARGENLHLTLGPENTAFALRHWNGNTFAFLPVGENANGLSALTFSPANGDRPATMKIEYLNENGLGTFKKI